MDFQDYLTKQFQLHPIMQPQDFVKMCYQAAFGAEHLLANISSAESYFLQEYEKTPASDGMLYEMISPSVCRINLSSWKETGMPAEWLFRMFVNSAAISSNGKALFEDYLKIADQFIQNQTLSFSLQDWNDYMTEYRSAGMPSVHHSHLYRESEHPAYRIINSRFIRLLPILKKAAALPDRDHAAIIAIDGRAASGKSTLADDLKLILQGSIVHIDDFFLPPALRTEERFSEPGGNVHYERFQSEVLPLLTDQASFSYRTFDCQNMSFGKMRLVENSNWRIVEGAYSHHPSFGSYADLKVFSDITPDMQMDRIRKRNGEWMAERFRTEWIPLEEIYYEYYHIKENADIVISANIAKCKN